MINRRRRCRYTLAVILMGIGIFYVAQIVLSSIFDNDDPTNLSNGKLDQTKAEQDIINGNDVKKTQQNGNQDKIKNQDRSEDVNRVQNKDQNSKKLDGREAPNKRNTTNEDDKTRPRNRNQRESGEKDRKKPIQKVVTQAEKTVATTKKSLNILMQMKMAAKDQIERKIKQARSAQSANDKQENPAKTRKGEKERPIFQPTLPQNHKPAAPGENGRAVDVPKEYQQMSEELFQKHHFNQWASDRISVHRTLPDPRPEMQVCILFLNYR